MIRALPLEVRSESRVRPTILTAFANAFEACVQTPGAGAEQRYGKRERREREVGPLDDHVDIGPGDYATYPSDRPHRWAALGAAGARVWVVHTFPRPAST